MTATELLDACSDLVNTELGVLGARCPYCQSYFEILPVGGRIDLGYCVGKTDISFEIAQSLSFDGLQVTRLDYPPRLILDVPDQRWIFQTDPSEN